MDDDDTFSYQFIGKTESGVHVVHTTFGGAGTMIFHSILLLTMEEDYGTIFDKDNLILKSTRRRLLIKKLGSIDLSDRWEGELKIDGNNLFIGKDVGWFSRNKTVKPKDRIIKIEYSPKKI